MPNYFWKATFSTSSAMSEQNSVKSVDRPRISKKTHESLEFSDEIATAPIAFQGKHKMRITVENTGDTLDHVLITAYYVTASHVRYVIYSEVSTLAKSQKLKKKISLKELPPSSKFYYLVEVRQGKDLLANYATAFVPVDLAKPEKYIKVDNINIPALTVIPGSSLIPRITLANDPLPNPVEITLQGQISCGETIVGEREERVMVGEEPIEQSRIYPLEIPIKKNIKADGNARLSMKVVLSEGEILLTEKEMNLTLDQGLEGLFYQQSGYKKESPSIYDLKFVVMNLKNQTKHRFSGKAKFHFFHPFLDDDLILSEDIRELLPQNYFRAAENLYLPPIFGARKFWIISQAWLKNEESGEDFLIEGISPQLFGKYAKKKLFDVQIRIPFRDNLLPQKLKMPLEIRIKNNGPVEYSDLVFRLFAIYGNRIKEEIAKVKIKNARDGQFFGVKWKTPDLTGTARLEPEFTLRGLRIKKKLIGFDSQEYFIVPSDFLTLQEETKKTE